MVGISFHVGSDCEDTTIFAKAIEASRKLFDFAETIGYQFTLLDIGGGFPGSNDTAIDEVRKKLCILAFPKLIGCFLYFSMRQSSIVVLNYTFRHQMLQL